MIRRRVLALVCAVGLLAVALTSAARPPETAGEIATRSVIIATLPCQPSVQATSSGFVIDDEHVVTVAHAIYETRDFAVRDATGQWHRPEIVHMDLDRDLAVLRMPGVAATPMPTSVSDSNEIVQMIDGAASGSLQGPIIRRVRLTIEAVGDLSRSTARDGYELGVAIQGGDSGAAVVDTDGNLVGVVFARSTRREAAWVTAASEITEALNGRAVPSWECTNPSDAELLLEVPSTDGLPDELALRQPN